MDESSLKKLWLSGAPVKDICLENFGEGKL